MSRRITATDRLRRIVAIVPWIAERDGPLIDEVCEQFGIGRADLLADLDVIFMVGIPPYTPDELIDVFIDEDRVWVTLGRYFTRPMKLTAQEALGVLAAGSGLAAISEEGPNGALSRALAKLRGALGITEGDGLAVTLGGADPQILATLQSCIAERKTASVDYYSYSSDEQRTRLIDPYRVYSTEGNWYLLGWAHDADAERLFRVDRMSSVERTTESYTAPQELPEPTSYSGNALERRITLDVVADARWVADRYPTDSVVDGPDGGFRIVLAVGGDAWLARLLLRLGPDATVVEPEAGAESRYVSPQQAHAIVSRSIGSLLEMY